MSRPNRSSAITSSPPDGRLSEDIDLIAVSNRKSVAADLDAALPRALARTHGRLTLDPILGSVPGNPPHLRWTDSAATTAVLPRPNSVADRATIARPALCRCPCRRAVGAHTSCLRSIQGRAQSLGRDRCRRRRPLPAGPPTSRRLRTTSRRRPQKPNGRASSLAKPASRSHRLMPWPPFGTLGRSSAARINDER